MGHPLQQRPVNNTSRLGRSDNSARIITNGRRHRGSTVILADIQRPTGNRVDHGCRQRWQLCRLVQVSADDMALQRPSSAVAKLEHTGAYGMNVFLEGTETWHTGTVAAGRTISVDDRAYEFFLGTDVVPSSTVSHPSWCSSIKVGLQRRSHKVAKRDNSAFLLKQPSGGVVDTTPRISTSQPGAEPHEPAWDLYSCRQQYPHPPALIGFEKQVQTTVMNDPPGLVCKMVQSRPHGQWSHSLAASSNRSVPFLHRLKTVVILGSGSRKFYM
jgi:hypothetical protein